MGSPAVNATTNSSGYFTLNLGDRTVAEVVGPGMVFSINTTPAGDFYNDVLFNNGTWPTNAIGVPTDVFTAGLGSQSNLGTISITRIDDTNPPPPPF